MYFVLSKIGVKCAVFKISDEQIYIIKSSTQEFMKTRTKVVHKNISQGCQNINLKVRKPRNLSIALSLSYVTLNHIILRKHCTFIISVSTKFLSKSFDKYKNSKEFS